MASFSVIKELEEIENKPHTERGLKNLEGIKKAHENLYGTEDEKRDRWENYQLYIDKLHTRRKSLSYSDLKEKTAKHFGCTSKTIDRHTNNPKKKS
jgi:hypothetical protein